MTHAMEPVGGAEPPTAHTRQRRFLSRNPQAHNGRWVVRGVVLALVHCVARVILGITTDLLPLHSSALRWSISAIVVLIAIGWGALDGRSGRAGLSPAPDTTLDWLRAGVLGGVVSGIVCVAIAGIDSLHLASNGAIFELTSGIGYTFLLIFLPAVIGVAAARLIGGRRSNKSSTTQQTHPETVASNQGGAGV